MAPQFPIGKQSYNLHPDATKTIATDKKLSRPQGMSPLSSESHGHLMKKQQTLKKEDLAPDWVWEYGIMG